MPASPPEAERRLVVGGRDIAYRLRRSARRTIGLSIDQRGLRVGAPQRAALRDIEALIRAHADWVLAKLDAWRERPPAPRLALVDGSPLVLFGTSCCLRLSNGRAGWRLAAGELQLSLPTGADPAALLERALREHARAVLGARLAHHAARFGVATPPLRLSSARTRWGSCSARGSINLNWRLVWLPLPVVDYVVCHELAHLREMNHGPRFWSLVGQLCPDWQAQRDALRRLGRDLPQL